MKESLPYKKNLLWGFLILMSVWMVADPLRGLVTTNRASLIAVHDSISPLMRRLADDLDTRCIQARQEYSVGEYQRVVDIMFAEWMSMPDVTLRMARCREAVAELAASLHSLGRFDDEEKVYRKLISINPQARDWVMHFAQLSLGDAALQRKDWVSAQDHYVIAYDCAVLGVSLVSEDIEIGYEKRAWQRLVNLAKSITTQGDLKRAVAEIQNEVDSAPGSPGWQVLAGIMYEQNCNYSEALDAFRKAQKLAPQARYLGQQITELQSSQPLCSP